MAKPLGTDDIEDVVSSVRRLVSPDARPRPVSRDLGLDTLLLTPALRVVADESRPEPLVLTARDAEPLDEAAIAEPAPFVEADGVADDGAEAPLHVLDGEWVDAFWSEQEPALAELALEVEEAELVTAELVTGQPDSPELPEDTPPAPEAFVADVAVEANGMAEAGTVFEAVAEPEPKPEPEPQPDAAQDVDPVAQAAEATPDLAAGDADILPFPQPTAAPKAGDTLAGLTDADGNPVTVLDEAALNEIVRSLIREELQGALGERITHNVRKLVRAEINRALTARSMD